MGLKIQLIEDGKIIFEMPIIPVERTRQHLHPEFRVMEKDFQRFSKIFDALSHETRLRMMKRMMEEEDRTMNFSAFMRDLDLNPKLVSENARKLREGGLLEKIGRGRYRCSEFGELSFLVMNFALKRLRDALGELEDF